MPDPFEILGLDKIERDLNRTGEATEKALTGVGEDIRYTWKLFVEATDAVDTRAYKHSINDHRVDAKQILLDTREDASVIYSDIVERGRRGRSGKFPAGKALDALDANDFVETRVNAEFDDILQH